MKKLLLLVILAVIATCILCCSRDAHEWRTIVRVVDGDTLVLDGGERVRLLGVDTPEKFESPKLERDARKSGLDRKTIQQMGERASAFTKSICEGKRCWLEYGQRRYDKYGRTLAVVHLANGSILNEEILRSGTGTPYLARECKALFRK